MTLPKKLLDIFDEETKNLQFGKVSISLVLRGEHCHYEIDKHFTVMVNENSKSPQVKGEENE